MALVSVRSLSQLTDPVGNQGDTEWALEMSRDLAPGTFLLLTTCHAFSVSFVQGEASVCPSVQWERGSSLGCMESEEAG